VFHQVAILTMDRDEIPGAHRIDHGFQFLPIGMARHVDVPHLFMNYLGSLPVQVVDDVLDGALIAGNEPGRKNNGVPRLDLEFLVVVECHSAQSAHGLSLAAGAQHDDLVSGQVAHRVRIDEVLVTDMEVAELPGDARDVDHGPSGDDDLASAGHGGVADLLDAMDVRGERGDDDALVRGGEDRPEGRTHLGFRRRVSGVLRACGVAEQKGDTCLAARAKPAKSVVRPSIGVWSSLKSPVWSTVPAGVRT